MLSRAAVERHASRVSCWVIINGDVWDLTDYMSKHPGGESIILKYAGKDATEIFKSIHPPGTIEKYIDKSFRKGTVPVESSQMAKKREIGTILPLQLILNLDELETAAKNSITPMGWTYISSAAEQLISLRNNRQDWSLVTFRPRTLVDVTNVDTSRRFFGFNSNLPFFIAPTARAKLAHEDGELCLVRGASKYNIPFCVSTYSSVEHSELSHTLSELQQGGMLAFQLYVQQDKQRTLELIDMAKKSGFKALAITIDTAVLGKREEDEKYQATIAYEQGIDEYPQSAVSQQSDDQPVPVWPHSTSLSWNDIGWLMKAWGKENGPVYLKGIQCAEDAHRALKSGVQGIYLSNHGGRQVDSGASSLMTLLEIRKFCPEVFGKLEIIMDGGLRRGGDILKAIALGATAVGMGRPFLFALGAYGTDGVYRAIQLLSEEIERTMRLIGVTNLNQLNPSYVNTEILQARLPQSLPDLSSKL